MVVRWFGILMCALALNAQEVRLQVLETTDVHGHVLPEDTFTLQPAQVGWAKLATLIRGLRAANPNTLLLDAGDATGGEPLHYVWSRLQHDAIEPSVGIMNLLGYQAMVVGHHEFDDGLVGLRLMEGQAQFPWLAANVVFADTGKPVFTPYLKLDVGGVSVAVLGLTTSAMPRLGLGDGLEGVRFQDAVATAKVLIPRLREQEQVDVVIVALHGGLGKLPCGPGDENQALGLAEVPGVDLILAGHTDQPLSVTRNGVPILQAGANGEAVGVGGLVLRKAKGKWALISREVHLVKPTAETVPDPAVLEATAPLRALADTYLNTLATNLAVDLDGRWCRMEDTPLMRLLHGAARRASGAQITALAPPGSHLFIAKGPTSVRQFYALLPEDDHMVRIQVTGAQLHAYLEHAARCFNLSHMAELFNKAVAPSDFDTLDGCTYTLDLTRPVGSRVKDLKVGGQAVTDAQHFSLGVTSRRFKGGGGYLEAMGWKGEAEFVSGDTLRNVLLEQVLSRPTLEPVVVENWHTIPALDRERVLAQQP